MEQPSFNTTHQPVDWGDKVREAINSFMDDGMSRIPCGAQATSSSASSIALSPMESGFSNSYSSAFLDVPQLPPGELYQHSRAIKELAHARSAMVDACSRYRREGEARNTVAKDCILIPRCGRYEAVTRGNDTKLVLSKIPEVFRIDTDSRHPERPYYLLAFSDPEQCCQIPVSDICKPGKLEAALAAQAPDVKFGVFGKEKYMVLEALAQEFRVKAKVYSYPLYLGWRKTEGHYSFSLLQGTTHNAKLPHTADEVEGIELHQGELNTVTIVAVQKITEIFNLIDDEDVRELIFIWLHLSFIYSILADNQCAPPVGLYLFCRHLSTFRLMKNLCGWYGDEPISLNESASTLLTLLPQRKDQPLLVRCQGANPENEAILQDMVNNHTIPAANSKAQPLPQQAPLTVLVKGGVHISRSPILLTVDIGSVNQLNGMNANKFSDCWKTHASGFAHYTSNNLRTLLDLVENADSDCGFLLDQETDLSYEGQEFLILYRSMRRFLQMYLESLELPQSALGAAAKLLSRDDSFLIDLIRHSSCSQSYDCEQFVWTAQKVLESGNVEFVDALCAIDQEYGEKDALAAIFFDREFCYLNTAAYRMIVLETGIPSRAMTDALKASNMLQGPFINKDSAQARLPTKYITGKTPVPVYKIRQEIIDEGRGAKSFFRRNYT